MDTYFYVLSLGTGILLSLIYFMGLWYTVKSLSLSQRPYLVVTLSFLVRTVIVLLGFYYLITLHWTHLLPALPAFIITRQVIIKKVGKPADIILE